MKQEADSEKTSQSIPKRTKIPLSYANNRTPKMIVRELRTSIDDQKRAVHEIILNSLLTKEFLFYFN